MATRKALALINGYFEEVNTPTDKLDFAGNTTTDLTEGTNLYYTNTRARQSISVTDSGGDGSLSYNNATGVITYTGPSATEVRAHLSAGNSGTGFGSLSYNNLTGVFTFSVVTSANIRQQISVTDSGGDGSLSYDNSTGVITYTGPSASEVRAHLSVAVGSGLTYNSATGIFGTSAIPNSQLANSAVTVGSTSISLGATATTIAGLSSLTSTSINVGAAGAANSILLDSAGITFEGSGVDTFETTLSVVNPTADRAISFPDASGTVALLTSLSVAAGSGLTYNNTTGEFGTSNIPNSQLQNSSITLGSSAVALGGTITTIAGLLSVTSATVLTNDGGFRIRNTTDNTKQIAFSAANITTATIRTLTVQDSNGTIALNNNKLSFFASTTSAELAGVISDETGSGSLVFGTSPSLTTPSLGVASATSINKVAITAPATGSTLTIADGKTLTVSNTLTFQGTDGSTIAFGAGGTIAYLGVNNAFTGANTFTNTTGQTFRNAATQDGVIIAGRAGGTSSYSATVTPTTLTANRTMILPDETGTVASQDFATAIAIALG